MTRREIARGFLTRYQQVGIDRSLKELAALLAETNRTNEIDLIIENIRYEAEDMLGLVSADVDSAFELSAEQIDHIRELISDMTDATSVGINHSIDPSLIGGFRFKTARIEYDATVRAKLSQLRGATR